MADKKEKSSAKKPIYESQESLYEKAMAKLKADELIVQPAYKISNFQLAASMFEEVGDYLDAPERAAWCQEAAVKAEEESSIARYDAAVFRIKDARLEDEWDHLAREFESLGEYRDAPEKAKVCRENLAQITRGKRVRSTIILCIAAVIAAAGIIAYATGFYRYVQGYVNMKGKSYTSAAETFKSMPGFLNSDTLAAECTRKALAASPVGKDVPIGDYKWKIIGRDDDGIVTLIAADVNGKHPCYRAVFQEGGGETTWADSSLRAWLNGEALETFFPAGSEMRDYLVLYESLPSRNERYQTVYEETTQDYLTLLSTEEAQDPKMMKYLKNLSHSYWLRTPGGSMELAAYIDGEQVIRFFGAPTDDPDMMVRPVIRIDSSAFGGAKKSEERETSPVMN